MRESAGASPQNVQLRGKSIEVERDSDYETHHIFGSLET